MWVEYTVRRERRKIIITLDGLTLPTYWKSEPAYSSRRKKWFHIQPLLVRCNTFPSFSAGEANLSNAFLLLPLDRGTMEIRWGKESSRITRKWLITMVFGRLLESFLVSELLRTLSLCGICAEVLRCEILHFIPPSDRLFDPCEDQATAMERDTSSGSNTYQVQEYLCANTHTLIKYLLSCLVFCLFVVAVCAASVYRFLLIYR